MSSQETFSITTLQRMCAMSEYLDESDIHMNDKTVSWDGNIIYYKNKKPTSTGNEFLIPIQVKGKEYNTLPDSDSISYPVDIYDLKNYLKNGGVIFFVDAISKSECPLCGTDFTDIDSAIIKTEKFIKNIHTDGIKIIEDIETQITNLFQKEIIPVLKVFLEENKVLIKMDDTLSGCKDLAVEKLQQLLDKVKISEFKSQGIEKFDIGEFSQQYENLLKELQEKEVPNKIIFQEKQVELYKSIHNTYYHNEKPYHTVGELQSKEQYVAKLFNDNLSQQLSTEEARLRKLKRDYEEYKNKTKDMTDAIKVLVGKYEDANKEYQTQLLNAIKIPLMVYSGRIIQNYPLGLGIRAVIKTNQLVFEAASKSGSDVYNILSTGQLNGLSIALLLSIKNVYGDTKGLDILLIDDPLQTIDDISAISLADLLTQQGIGQIVLSTHEEAKAALLRYKFKHAGMSVREQNMQALYMKTVTEE